MICSTVDLVCGNR